MKQLLLLFLVAFMSFIFGRTSIYFYSLDILFAILSNYYMAFITIVGWFAVFLANYYLQEKRIEKDKINSARSDIVRCLREYRKWLQELSYEYNFYSVNKSEKKQVKENKLCPSDWVDYLSDYNILFNIDKEREILIKGHTEIIGKVVFISSGHEKVKQEDVLSLQKLLRYQLETIKNIVSNMQQQFYDKHLTTSKWV